MTDAARQPAGKLKAVTKPYLTRADFPDVGENRFFVVEHNPKSVSQPVRVELREAIADGRRIKTLSRLLGIEYAIAAKESILEAAARLEARVGRIDDCVGTY